jgi:hypothetical protein
MICQTRCELRVVKTRDNGYSAAAGKDDDKVRRRQAKAMQLDVTSTAKRAGVAPRVRADQHYRAGENVVVRIRTRLSTPANPARFAGNALENCTERKRRRSVAIAKRMRPNSEDVCRIHRQRRCARRALTENHRVILIEADASHRDVALDTKRAHRVCEPRSGEEEIRIDQNTEPIRDAVRPTKRVPPGQSGNRRFEVPPLAATLSTITIKLIFLFLILTS